MLPKSPKSAFWNYFRGGVKTVFIIESVCFAVSYGVYYRMNTNRDFRLYMNENYPFVLDYYYKIGEIIGDNKQRQYDSAVWQAKETKDN